MILALRGDATFEGEATPGRVVGLGCPRDPSGQGTS